PPAPYALSLHDALPISVRAGLALGTPHLSMLLAFLFTSMATVPAAPLIPTADGTSWRYNMTEEIGKGLDIRDAKPDAEGKIRLRSEEHTSELQSRGHLV